LYSVTSQIGIILRYAPNNLLNSYEMVEPI
jgi:hypothetical protein